MDRVYRVYPETSEILEHIIDEAGDRVEVTYLSEDMYEWVQAVPKGVAIVSSTKTERKAAFKQYKEALDLMASYGMIVSSSGEVTYQEPQEVYQL